MSQENAVSVAGEVSSSEAATKYGTGNAGKDESAQPKRKTKETDVGETAAPEKTDVRSIDLKALFTSAVLSSEDPSYDLKHFDHTNLGGCNGYTRLTVELPYNNENLRRDLRILMGAAEAGYTGHMTFAESDTKRQTSAKTVQCIVDRKQFEKLIKFLQKLASEKK